MDDVRCKGTERSLFSCRQRDLGQHNCNFNELAGVLCMLRPKSTSAPVYGKIFQPMNLRLLAHLRPSTCAGPAAF